MECKHRCPDAAAHLDVRVLALLSTEVLSAEPQMEGNMGVRMWLSGPCHCPLALRPCPLRAGLEG
jgi:hypothetical protein